MSSDESDSYHSYPSDGDIPCSPCELETMNTSSSSDDEETTIHNSPPYLYVRVKEKVDNRASTSIYKTYDIRDGLSLYFAEIVPASGPPTFFPHSMEKYLTKRYPKLLHSLRKLNYDHFFIYVAKTLAVTLNINNTRIRIPRSLICDVCIFSHSQPTLVISFTTPNHKPKRLDMYNTFVARGVTEALRTFACENISVVNGVSIEGREVSDILPKLQASSNLFNVPSSLTTSREKASLAAKALLRSIAVSAAHPILYEEKHDSRTIFFLTKDEFAFLSNNIDMENQCFEFTLSGDRNLLALELSIRKSKQDKTALVLKSLHEKLKPDETNSFRNLEVFNKSEVFAEEHSRYTLIIAGTFRDIKPAVGSKARVIILSQSKTDAKALKKHFQKKPAEQSKQKSKRPSSFFNYIFKKKKQGSVGIAERLLGSGSVSTPNLRADDNDDSSADEEKGSILYTSSICDQDLKTASPRAQTSLLSEPFGLKTPDSSSILPEVEGDKTSDVVSSLTLE